MPIRKQPARVHLIRITGTRFQVANSGGAFFLKSSNDFGSSTGMTKPKTQNTTVSTVASKHKQRPLLVGREA
jgi:hypothetical protein